jgi:hypothetical protein
MEFKLNIPLIDPYPLHQAPYSHFLIQQREAEIKSGYTPKPLPELICIRTPKEHIISALNNFSTNKLTTMIKEKLSNLDSYKNTIKSMPNLSRVNGLKNYRQKHPNHDNNTLTADIEQYGLLLSSGQVVFHGGLFPRDANGIPLQKFTTDRFLSTTLCAQVAAVHSFYHTPKEVWLIRITQEAKLKAFVYSNDSRQTHGHETEILLDRGARMILKSSFNEKDFTIYQVEVS